LVLTLALLGAGMIYRNWGKDFYVLQDHSLRAAYFVPSQSDQVVLHLIVQSGEMDNLGTQGIPHFVEHLAWANAMGGANGMENRHTNAFTSAMGTDYVLSLPADQAPKGLATLAKVLNPLPPDNDFMRSERDIVMREYDWRERENPISAYIDRINQAGYIHDPRARSIIGTPADIASFSLEEAREWHQATHVAQNTILLMSGPFSDRLANILVSQVFSGPKTDAPAIPVDFRLGPQETVLRRHKDARFAQPLINLQKTVELHPPLDMAHQTAQLGLLYDLLDSTLEGSYAKPLRFDAAIAQGYQLQIFAHSDRHYELSIVGARPDKGVDLDGLKDGLLAAIQNAHIPTSSFIRVKERWLKRQENEIPQKVTFDLVHTSILRRTSPVGYDDYIAAARAITLDDMNRFADAFAGPGRTIIDLISPE
jgi:predicted Zn-dependent peptidase